MSWQHASKISCLVNSAGVSLILPGRKKPIALFRVDDNFFAVADECSHTYAPLAEGLIKEHVVTCPWHGGEV